VSAAPITAGGGLSIVHPVRVRLQIWRAELGHPRAGLVVASRAGDSCVPQEAPTSVVGRLQEVAVVEDLISDI